MQTIAKLISTFITCVVVLALNACSSGDPSNALSGRGDTGNLTSTDQSFKPGTISISITDAAVDSAQEVWVQFTGVTIQPSNGDAIEFIFNNVKNINLLSLQGTLSADLIDDEVILPGNYDWVRLHVNANYDSILDSYIRLDDGSTHELNIPSGSQTGLKINTSFELLATEELNLMIDFDLRKSVVLSAGTYKLRPTLRMVNLNNTNSITGTIDSSLLTGTNCSDTNPVTGNSVYVFEGNDVVADDMDNQNPEPLSSARVKLNSSTGNYEYIIGFVPAGNYTVAFTCQADLDDPDSNDNIIFSLTENVTVIADTTGNNDNNQLPNPAR